MIVVSESPDSKKAANEYVGNQLQSRSTDRIEFVGGHDAFFGIHHFTDRQPYYFTFLRDPVKRFLSNFRFLRDCARDPNSAVHSFAAEAMLNGEEFKTLEEVVDQGRLGNMMSHYLAATVEPDLLSARWYRTQESELLKNAKTAIDRFDFLGFFESLEDDARFLCEQMDVPFKSSPVNQTTSRITDPLSEPILARIEELNWLDLEIYRYARQRRRSAGSDQAPLA